MGMAAVVILRGLPCISSVTYTYIHAGTLPWTYILFIFVSLITGTCGILMCAADCPTVWGGAVPCNDGERVLKTKWRRCKLCEVSMQDSVGMLWKGRFFSGLISLEVGWLAWLCFCVFFLCSFFSFLLSQLIPCSHTCRSGSHVNAIAFTQTTQGVPGVGNTSLWKKIQIPKKRRLNKRNWTNLKGINLRGLSMRAKTDGGHSPRQLLNVGHRRYRDTR